VWSIKGALARMGRLSIVTAVTRRRCASVPAMVAQPNISRAIAAARGRFVVGIGTSEALNEHVTTARQANSRRATSLPLALRMNRRIRY